jgi:hypothetical protein
MRIPIRDLGSRRPWIRKEKFGSGIRDKHPVSATLALKYFYLFYYLYKMSFWICSYFFFRLYVPLLNRVSSLNVVSAASIVLFRKQKSFSVFYNP